MSMVSGPPHVRDDVRRAISRSAIGGSSSRAKPPLLIEVLRQTHSRIVRWSSRFVTLARMQDVFLAIESRHHLIPHILPKDVTQVFLPRDV